MIEGVPFKSSPGSSGRDPGAWRGWVQLDPACASPGANLELLPDEHVELQPWIEISLLLKVDF